MNIEDNRLAIAHQPQLFIDLTGENANGGRPALAPTLRHSLELGLHSRIEGGRSLPGFPSQPPAAAFRKASPESLSQCLEQRPILARLQPGQAQASGRGYI